MRRALLWFRTDLRLHDNLALTAALKENDEIVPVYIFDEQWLGKDQWGFQRTGAYRMQFLLESLTDLKDHLQELGSDLIVQKGDPAVLLSEMAQKYECDTIYCSKEYTSEEVAVENRVSQQLNLKCYHNSPMIHPDDVTFAIDRMPEVFTAFRKKVERYSEVRIPLETPEAIPSPKLDTEAIPPLKDFHLEIFQQDKRGVLPFKGGSVAAWNRLDHYFWDTEKLSVYKKTRNGLVGADYSSKFSPWLAHGCISARAIYDEVERYEDDIEKNDSTYWLKFELLWRDFFKYTAMRYGNRIFHANGIKDKNKKWGYRPRIMQKWIDGETGDDFVDANMIELKSTGFMSNRGRQNVASYLVHQLNLDWRAGAAWFESMLIDYDVTSNYGNWIYAAGVGNDPRDRVFNTQKQASMYDKSKSFRRLWLADK
ncbi:MAG: DASH family cryptochrome [Bacteroidota bacterium]